MVTSTVTSPERQTPRLLLELGVQPRLLGFRQLCVGIDRYSAGDILSMSKELYPYIGELTGCSAASVEHSIRYTITDAWNRRDPEVWGQYFPDAAKIPSNKEFIAILTICQ